MPSLSFALAFTLALQGATGLQGGAEAPLQGEAAAPVRVHVDGVSSDVRRNIRANLSIYQRREDPELPESTVLALHDRAPSEIRRALRPFGYYRPTVRAELERGADRWVARYRVDPGEPVRYAAVDVTFSGAGADDRVLRRVVPESGVRKGEPLRHEVWEAAKQALLNRTVARGYLDVEVTRSRVEVDTVGMEARAVLAVETGPRYRFGEVRFDSTPFTQRFLHRFVTFEPGQHFSLDALLEMQRALTSSDYFRMARVEPLRDEADSLRVPIQVGLETRMRNQYTIGAGYGTDTGVRGRASGQRRWLNDRGHRVRGEVRASLRDQAFQAQYVIPLAGGAADRMAATTVYQRESFEGLESRRVFGRLELDHGRGGWREVASIRLVEEWFRDAAGSRSTTLLIPEMHWTRVRGDDVLYPRRGHRFEVGVSGASDAVVSDLTFVQATAELNVARGLHRTGRVLLRLGTGATVVESIEAMPVSLRLYAGGDRSVRGFSYRSLGPVGADGDITGGRHQLTGSIELEQEVMGPFAIAVFTDAGNVFADRAAVDLGALEQGAGFGLRWRSPIGSVRADLAWPVSRLGDAPRVHFVVGGTL
ncbi:MAG: autotransporter assembly complex family protein [Longimicrobiales bacterium]